MIIAVDPLKERRDMARRFGASSAIDPAAMDVVEAIKRLTEWRGADVAIDTLGGQNTFEADSR